MSVANTISDAQSFATTMANSVSTMLATTGNYVNNLGYSSLPTAYYNYTYTPPTYTDDLTTPNTEVAAFQIPTASLPTIAFRDLPPITDNFNYPEAANVDLTGLFTAVAPNSSINSLQVTAPSIDIQALRDYMNAVVPPMITSIASPALQTVTIPDIPTLHLPSYQYSALEGLPAITGDTSTVFTTTFDDKSAAMRSMVDSQISEWLTQYAPEYKNVMLQLQTKLQASMTDGNALSEEYENRLYNRAKSKIALEQARVEADLDRQHAKRGFIVPPGSLVAGRNNLHQAAADNLSISATEIAIKRAEMEIQHMQFAMQLAATTELGLQGIATNYAGVVLQAGAQALEYAKTCADLFLGMYKLGFERYNLLIQKYQIEANVYETLLKAALAELEIYRLQLEGAKATKEIEALDVSVYSKRIEGENLKINQYTSLVETVVKRAEVEKIALDLYGESVKAYVAEVQAKAAEFSIYESAVKADATKLQGELSKLEVVKSQLESIKLKTEVESNHAAIIANYNNNLSTQYALELKKYEAEIAAQSTKVTSDVAIRKLALEAYSTDLNANLNKYQSDISAVKPYLEYELAKMNDKTARDVADANRTLGFIKAQTDINGLLADTSTKLAVAALNAQTTITSDLISQVTNL